MKTEELKIKYPSGFERAVRRSFNEAGPVWRSFNED
jgi:hypothetical protein